MTFASREQSRYTGSPLECFRFVVGSSLYLWTRADQAITLPVGTFEPATITSGGSEFGQENSSGSVEVRVPRDNPIASLFVPGLPPAPIGLVIYRAHRGEESDYKARFVGSVEACALEEVEGGAVEAVLTCLRSSARVRRQFPIHTFQSKCNHATYSPGCGLLAANFRTAAVLSFVSGVTIKSADVDALADGWFNGGWIEIPGGEKVRINAHAGDTLTLFRPFSVAPAVGATLHAFAGDDQLEATCTTKFANLVNFRGFPRIPVRNPFVGSVA